MKSGGPDHQIPTISIVPHESVVVECLDTQPRSPMKNLRQYCARDRSVEANLVLRVSWGDKRVTNSGSSRSASDHFSRERTLPSA